MVLPPMLTSGDGLKFDHHLLVVSVVSAHSTTFEPLSRPSNNLGPMIAPSPSIYSRYAVDSCGMTHLLSPVPLGGMVE